MTAFDESAWNGSASNWDTPEAYCRDCLIDLNAPNSEKTKDKCKLPYRKPGSKAVNKNALRAIGTGARGLPAVDAPPEEKRKAANWVIRLWPQAFNQPAPEGIYKIAGKSRPAQKTVVYKDSGGTAWFVGVYSNNFEDREKDIFTWDSHVEYANWIKTSGVKPPIILIHQPPYPPVFHVLHVIALEKGLITPEEFTDNLMAMYKTTAVAQTEGVIPLNGFMLVVGKIFPDKLPLVEELMERKSGWGMSHGFVKTEYDGNIINKYRTFEFTLAPAEWVANIFTPIGFNKDNIMSDMKLSAEDQELLERALGGSAGEREEGFAAIKRVLEKYLDHKTLETPEEEVEEEEQELQEEPLEYDQIRNKIFADLDVEGLQKAFKSLGELVVQLNEKVTAVDGKMQQYAKSEDERIAEQIAPPKWVFDFKQQGDSDPELIERLKEDEDRVIVDEKATEEGQDNVLKIALWDQLLPESR